MAGSQSARAEVFGKMFDDSFACVQLDAKKLNKVQGWIVSFPNELYQYKLKKADGIEGIPTLYQRSKTTATVVNSGVQVEVWIYTRKDADKRRPVLSGDWVQYQTQLLRGVKK